MPRHNTACPEISAFNIPARITAMARGNRREVIFHDDDDRRSFLTPFMPGTFLKYSSTKQPDQAGGKLSHVHLAA